MDKRTAQEKSTQGQIIFG